MPNRLQSSTTQPIPFRMVLASDHLSPATSLSPVVTLSKNGAAFGAAAGAVTELAQGWYLLAGNATDRNTTGTLLLRAAVATADDAYTQVEITAQDPFAAGVVVTTNNDKTGYTASTVSDKTGYALTSGEHTNVTADVWDAARSAHLTAGSFGMLGATCLRDNTATAGAASTITLDAGASTTVGLYIGCVLILTAGTGAGQAPRIVTAYSAGRAATLAPAWTTVPDNTSKFAILAISTPLIPGTDNRALESADTHTSGATVAAVTGAVGSVTGNVGGNVTGTVASVVTKTGYALTSGEHTLNVADAQAALTAQGYTTGRGPLLDHLDADMSTRATPAQVRTQVSGALTADTIAELAQGLPPVTPTVTQALALMYLMLRNGVTEDGTYKKVFNDAGVCIAKAQTTDSGTVFTVHKMVTGP